MRYTTDQRAVREHLLRELVWILCMLDLTRYEAWSCADTIVDDRLAKIRQAQDNEYLLEMAKYRVNSDSCV